MKIYRILFTLVLSLIVFQAGVAGSKQQSIGKSLPLMAVSNPEMKTRENSHYLPDRIILKLKTSVVPGKNARSFGITSVDNYLQKYSVESIGQIFTEQPVSSSGKNTDMSKFYVLKYSSPVDAFTFAEELSKLPEVQYAEPWFIYPVSDVQSCRPNDYYRGSQWGLTKILADTAWCIEQGDTSVVIGVIDTGVQWDHPDLQSNIWINPGEYGPDGLGGFKQSNGIDDDGNGKIDDWHGWDFGGANYSAPVPDNNPMPGSSGNSTHGTHVTGIASAVTNNSIGVSGIGNKCKILSVKTASDNDPYQYIVFGFEGIYYAATMGAKIISLSWGGTGASQFEQEIIDSATALGALVVAAAGNTGNTILQYPASYRGVISVAATVNAPADTKASYSSYNECVDVAAPGDNIFSTLNPNTYGYMSGTSMATPLVSGLAALVKSHFPSYTNLQVGEQVRVSSDNINSLNPSYADLLGKGRINALNALTVISPSLRMTSFVTSDSIGGNNNGILQPNETFSLIANIRNYLAPTSGAAAITLSSADPYVQIVSGNYPIGTLGTLVSSSNSASPYRVLIKSNMPPAHEVTFKLAMTDGSYSDVQLFKILINPTYATHTVNNVGVTLTNIGRVGFVDLNNQMGIGFVYGGENQLYEGGLMVGYSPTKLVDVVRNDTCQLCQDHDFSSASVYTMLSPGTISSQDGSTAFTDSLAASAFKIGLQINMYSYAFTTPADSNYVLLRYDIKNVSGTQITNLFAGLFFDWDITGPQVDYYNYNRTTFDNSMNLGYAWNAGNPNTVYCGARALEGSAYYRGLVNSTSLIPNRAAKWSWLSGGVVYTDSIKDIHFVISSGPFTIENGATQMVAFALLGAMNSVDLGTYSETAYNKWLQLKRLLAVSEQSNDVPGAYALRQNFPNPFNPTTKMRFTIADARFTTLKVYDVLGQVVATLVNEVRQPGEYSVQWDPSASGGLPSGVYYYRLQSGNFSETRKLIFMK